MSVYIITQIRLMSVYIRTQIKVMRTLSILTAMLDTLVSQWNQNKMLMLKPNPDNLIESNHCDLSIQ